MYEYLKFISYKQKKSVFTGYLYFKLHNILNPLISLVWYKTILNQNVKQKKQKYSTSLYHIINSDDYFKKLIHQKS